MEKYETKIDYIGNTPLTLNIKCKDKERKIGFFNRKETELVEDFIGREISNFLEDINPRE